MKVHSANKILVLTALLAFFTGASKGAAQSVDDLVAKGDGFDQRLDAAEALEYYLPAEKADPKNAKILARIARQYRHLLTDARSPEEKLRLGRLAIDYANRAAAAAPDDSDAQLSVALSHGKVLPSLGVHEQVDASNRIKDSVDKALRLNPRNDLGWYVLGKWNRVLADVGATKRFLAPLFGGKLPRGTNQDAVKCLKMAIDLNPYRPMYHIELGRTYAQMGNASEARKCINTGLSMPNVDKEDPEAKVHGREALDKMR
jgi:tetratricopeptide (TPR) repeat protein